MLKKKYKKNTGSHINPNLISLLLFFYEKFKIKYERLEKVLKM